MVNMKFKFPVLLLLIVHLLYACKEPRVGEKLELDMSKMATLKGFVSAQLTKVNDSVATTYEAVPQGTKIIFKVENNEYLLSAGGFQTFETFVGAGGRYAIDIPVTSRGINFWIIPTDFEYDQRQAAYNSNNQWVESGIERRYYTVGEKTLFNLVEGEVRIENIQYEEHNFQ